MITKGKRSHAQRSLSPTLLRFVQCTAIAVAAVVAAGCSSEEKVNDGLTIDPTTVPCQGAAWSDDVCIPGGEFIMGHDALPYTPPPCPPGENCGPGNPPLNDFAPKHKVRLSPYFIDRRPATNKQYRACVEAGQCIDECKIRKHCSGQLHDQYSIHDTRLDDYPVLTVEKEGAADYCRWVGKRVPTEAEWERAARGRQSFDYPWGNEAPDCSKYLCDMDFQSLGWTRIWSVTVGANAGDISPDGIQDMVTNSREHTADFYDSQYYYSSPIDNPQGPSSKLIFRTLRGNVYDRGHYASGIEFNGMSFPTPAWVRDSSSTGAPRCARSDSGSASIGQQFYRARQVVLSGRRLSQ